MTVQVTGSEHRKGWEFQKDSKTEGLETMVPKMERGGGTGNGLSLPADRKGRCPLKEKFKGEAWRRTEGGVTYEAKKGRTNRIEK